MDSPANYYYFNDPKKAYDFFNNKPLLKDLFDHTRSDSNSEKYNPIIDSFLRSNNPAAIFQRLSQLPHNELLLVIHMLASNDLYVEPLYGDHVISQLGEHGSLEKVSSICKNWTDTSWNLSPALYRAAKLPQCYFNDLIKTTVFNDADNRIIFLQGLECAIQPHPWTKTFIDQHPLTWTASALDSALEHTASNLLMDIDRIIDSTGHPTNIPFGLPKVLKDLFHNWNIVYPKSALMLRQKQLGLTDDMFLHILEEHDISYPTATLDTYLANKIASQPHPDIERTYAYYKRHPHAVITELLSSLDDTETLIKLFTDPLTVVSLHEKTTYALPETIDYR